MSSQRVDALDVCEIGDPRHRSRHAWSVRVLRLVTSQLNGYARRVRMRVDLCIRLNGPNLQSQSQSRLLPKRTTRSSRY